VNNSGLGSGDQKSVESKSSTMRPLDIFSGKNPVAKA
jgi:hypothetical protein